MQKHKREEIPEDTLAYHLLMFMLLCDIVLLAKSEFFVLCNLLSKDNKGIARPRLSGHPDTILRKHHVGPTTAATSQVRDYSNNTRCPMLHIKFLQLQSCSVLWCFCVVHVQQMQKCNGFVVV